MFEWKHPMVTTLWHFCGRSPLKKSSAPNLNPISFTRPRHWNGNKIIHKHFIPWSKWFKSQFFLRILHGQNAGMRSDIFCLWPCECYGYLWAQQSTWHPGKCDGLLIHPLYEHLPCHSFNIYFMKRWCLTKDQNDNCVSLCSLLGASYPTSFNKSMSAATPEISYTFS